MRARALRLCRMAALLLLLPVTAALAQADPSAIDWLHRIYAATQKLNYTGIFVYQQGQQVETSRITHIVDAGGPRERLETLDGVPREIVRSRDQVVCYLPATSTVKIDKRLGQHGFPAILPEQFNDLSENYSISKGAVERVGGYNCQVVMLEPKDRMRFGHRLWADLNTGMLLKAKTLDERHNVLEQFAFTQLQIGGNISADRVKAHFSRASRGWRVEESESNRTNLAEAGWSIRARPAGFRTVAELTRTLGGTSGVGHIVLSDGLAAVSVFIEPAASKHSNPRPGLVRQGVINVYMRPVGGYWITVVGEAPAESVKYIANAVEFRK